MDHQLLSADRDALTFLFAFEYVSRGVERSAGPKRTEHFVWKMRYIKIHIIRYYPCESKCDPTGDSNLWETNTIRIKNPRLTSALTSVLGFEPEDNKTRSGVEHGTQPGFEVNQCLIYHLTPIQVAWRPGIIICDISMTQGCHFI